MWLVIYKDSGCHAAMSQRPELSGTVCRPNRTALDAATQVLVTSIIIVYLSAMSRVIWSFFWKKV